MEPEREQIAEHLAKLLASDCFSASPSSSRLLNHLVRETLEGRPDRLKGYSIGVDVFERGVDFDPNSDSIVRVQMGRLRKLLEQYRESDLAGGDAVTITIPKGSYVPVISIREAQPAPIATLATPSGEPARPNRRKRLFAGLAALFMLALAGWAVWFFLLRDTAPVEAEPKVFVAQYRAIDRSPETSIIARGLQHELITQLSQYPNLAVLGYESVLGEGDGAQITDLHGADYILNGSVTTGDGKIAVSSALSSSRNGLIIWSKTINLDYANAGDVLQAQSAIALSVGSVLGQPDGVIQQASKALVAESRGVSFSNYACILAAYDYKRLKEERAHRDVRACLERVVKDSPNYSSAWALLSWVYGDQHRYGFAGPAQPSALSRSLQAGQMAVKTNPFSATAHQYLSIAQFYAGRDAEARKSIETAVRLSPNNSEILADAGWQHALVGDEDAAMRYFAEAVNLNPDPPVWYWGGLAIDALRRNDPEQALKFAELYNDDGILSDYVLAAAKRANGDIAGADAIIARIARSNPGLDRPGNSFAKSNRISPELSAWIFGTD